MDSLLQLTCGVSTVGALNDGKADLKCGDCFEAVIDLMRQLQRAEHSDSRQVMADELKAILTFKHMYRQLLVAAGNNSAEVAADI